MELYGSLTNRLMGNAKSALTPTVGMGATILMFTDRHAGTIVQASDWIVIVRKDKAIRTDQNGMSDSQSYRYEPNPEGQEWTFKRSLEGWREARLNPASKATAPQRRYRLQKGGAQLLVGERAAYHDYSF